MNNTSWFVLIIFMISNNAIALHDDKDTSHNQETHPLVRQLKQLDLDDQEAVAWHVNNIKSHGFTLQQLVEKYVDHKKNRALSVIQEQLRITPEEMATLCAHGNKIIKNSQDTAHLIGRMFYIAQGNQAQRAEAHQVQAMYPVIYEAVEAQNIQGIIHVRIHDKHSDPATLIAKKKLFFNQSSNMWQLIHESQIDIHKNFWLLSRPAQKALANAELQAKLSQCSQVLPELILNHLRQKFNVSREARNNLTHSPDLQKLGRALELAECIIPASSDLQSATNMKHLITTYLHWALLNNKKETAEACSKLLRNVCVIEKLLYTEQDLESKK